MLKQKLSLGFISKIIIQMIQMVSSIVVARVAGPTVLGTVSFGLAFVGMFRFIGALGLGSAHFKIMHEGYKQEDCTKTYAILHLATKTMFLVTVGLYFIVQKYVFGYPFESKDHEYVIIVLMISIFLETIIDIPRANFGARTEQAKQDIPDIIRVFFNSTAKIFTVLMGGSAIALAATNIYSLVFVIPIYLYLFRNESLGKFDKVIAKKYLLYGLPLVVMGLSQSLLQTLDKVLLQYFTNSEQVGYYSAGFRIGSYFMIIAYSSGLIFFPLFSKAVKEKNIKLIKDKVKIYQRFIFTNIMPLMIFLAIYADTIVNLLLGARYAQSIVILRVVTLAMFPIILNVPFGNVITGFGDFKTTARLSIYNIIILVISLVILVNPKLMNLGSLGAAIGYTISQLYRAVSFEFIANKKIPKLSLHNEMLYILFGLVAFSSSLYIYDKLFKSSYLMIALFPFIFFGVVYLSMYLLKLINKSDFIMLKSLFNPKLMKSYISEEVKK